MPVEYAELEINGKSVNDAIHLLKGGVIANNANIRNQIVTCDTLLLQPPVKTTPQTIGINHFFARRINEVKGSNGEKYSGRVRRLNKTITFEDMYKHIGLDKANRNKKFHAREVAFKILDFFVSENILNGYTVNKSEDGEILGVTIDF